MAWINDINQALQYMENNLNHNINVEDVVRQAYTSSSHFQRVFTMVTGITIGEYLRNRRLSLAARELHNTDCKVIDIAFKYQYETPESFSKAFYRFHGINPSDVKTKPESIKYFNPMYIQITIQGGFTMEEKKFKDFCWNNLRDLNGKELTDKEKYQAIIGWAGNARCKNPTVFDEITEWILDDSEWTADKMEENEQILMRGVLGRFKEQNNQLRAYLKQLEPSGVVNPAVFKMLDRFDKELSGTVDDVKIQGAITKIFADFSNMRFKDIRALIAGNKTGPEGVDSVDIFGYINRLKESDASVQWTLFMPGEVERKQKGFSVKSFDYIAMPAMKFVGFEGEEYEDVNKRLAKMHMLDDLADYKSGFDYDIFFMHFNGECVDVGTWHGLFGRFMKADTPVPEGFVSYDFITAHDDKQGVPYISQFAFATFEGDPAILHEHEGYDSDAMYDTTRNIILGQGGEIPYPAKYWSAEVFMDGCDKDGYGYLFSARMP